MIINPYSSEVENITFAIEAQTPKTIAFTSANSKEGVSTVAHSVTQRLLLSGHSVLLVDLNTTAPAVEKILENDEGSPDLVSPRGELSVFTGVTLGSNKANIAQLRKPNVLSEMLGQWRAQFDYIIVDCPPVLRSDTDMLSAEHVVLACDSVILVTLAQRTTESCLTQAVRKLDHEGVHLLGIVVNDQMNPGLKDEFLRQINKLRSLLPSALTGPLNTIGRMIERNPFFSIDN